MIQGWDEGVMKMSLGEKAILRVSSDYAYGSAGAAGVIPPNADLVFEVHLRTSISLHVFLRSSQKCASHAQEQGGM